MRIARYLVWFALLLTKAAKAQYWVDHCGGEGIDRVVDITTDAGNAIYVIGDYSVGAEFEGQGLVSFGATDVFVAKLDAAGGVQWIRQAGGLGIDLGASISVGVDGSVLVVGEFTGTADLFGATVNSNGGTTDLFIAKLNATDGSTAWVRTGGSATYSDRATDVTVALDGRVLVTGEFRGSGVFDAGTFNSTIDPGTSLPGSDVFLMSYSNAGTSEWFKHGSAPRDDQAAAVVVDLFGNAYLCGQYSENITFDVLHPNVALNQAFVVKFDATGAEQWFRRIGGAALQRIADVKVDDLGALVIAGELQGSLNFYDTSPDLLVNTASFAYFLARVGTDGEYVSGVAIGSQNDVGVGALDVRGNGIAVYGDFQCGFEALAAHYGATGLFIANGTRDLFIARHDGGTLALSAAQQFGGHREKRTGGICSLTNGELLFGGSFEELLIIPSNGAEWNDLPACDPGDLSCGSSSYCGDPNYNRYEAFESEGLTDGFVARAYVTGRSPYDNWCRSGVGCDRSPLELSISAVDSPPGDASFSCGTDTLQWDRSIARWEVSTGCGADRSASWEVDVTWSTGSSNDTIHVNSTGWYWVSLASSNGCYNEVDSFYVTILDKPEAALYVSDFPDPVVPEEGIPCTIIAECAPLWLHHLPQPPGSTVSFIALGSPVANDSVLMNATGNYSFTVTLANGCSTTNVICFTLLQSVDLPEITSATMQYTYEGVPLDVEDSLAFCGALCMEGIMIPTWYNNGVPVPLGEPYYAVYSTAGGCGQTQNFVNQPFYWSAIVDETGWYPLNTHLVMYVEGCSNDSLVFDFQDSVYIVPVEAPMIPQPDTAFTCPGDTVALLLNCSNCQQVEWSGEGIIAVSAEGDTAWVNETGYFTAIVTNMEQGLTCVAAEYFPVFPAIPPQLVLVPPNGLVCPGEDVLIYTPSQAAEYEWFGPNGPLNIDNDSVVVSEVGNYYLTIYTPSGCSLANGPASVQQFGSPLIVAFPDNLICPGQVAALQVQGGVITQVQWQAPLSGSDLTQTVNAGGTYVCDVVSCGTPYTLTLPVIEGNPDATIDVGPFVVCGGSTVVLDGPAGDYTYLWTPGNVATEDLLVTMPGNYQLQITDSIGCTDVSEVAVVNSTSFTEPLSVDGGAVCAGTTIDLSATGSGTIGWYADSTLQVLLAEGGAYTAGPFSTTDTLYAAQTENDCLGPAFPVVITILSPVVPVIEGDTTLCTGADLELSVAVQAGVTFTWSTPQGTITGTEVNVDDITIVDVGAYTCTATVLGCPGVSASVTVEVVAGPTVPVITGDTGLCAGDALNLSVPQQSGAVFSWTTPQGNISGTTVSVAQTDASDAGTYGCTVAIPGCTSQSASVVVVIDQPAQIPSLSGDTVLCAGTPLILVAAGAGVSAAVWTAPNSATYTGPMISMPAASLALNGTFICVVPGGNCPGAASSIDVQVQDCDTVDVVIIVPPIVIPNVFSPNGDGRNDVFLIEGSTGLALSMRVFNRWGSEVWNGSGESIRWNGRNAASETLSDGVYYYELVRSGAGLAEPVVYTGFVQLVGGR